MDTQRRRRESDERARELERGGRERGVEAEEGKRGEQEKRDGRAGGRNAESAHVCSESGSEQEMTGCMAGYGQHHSDKTRKKQTW